MQKVLHLRDDIDFVSRQERERELGRIEDKVNASIRVFKVYVIKNKERLITMARSNTDNKDKQNKTNLDKRKKKNNCVDISSNKLLIGEDLYMTKSRKLHLF